MSQYNEFQQVLWPFSMPLAYPVPLRWLHPHPEPGTAVREGLIPLLWYLRSQSRRGEKIPKLYVRKEIRASIPRCWQHSLGTYRLVSVGEHEDRTEKLLLMGLVHPQFVTFSSLERRLGRIARWLEGRQNLRKLLYLPVPAGAETFLGRYFQLIFRFLGSDVDILGYEDLLDVSLFRHCAVGELSDGLLLGANAAVDYALSQGGRLLFQDPLTEGETFFPSSPFHGVAVQEVYPRARKQMHPEEADFLHAIGRKAKASKDAMPWPGSFAQSVSDWADLR